MKKYIQISLISIFSFTLISLVSGVFVNSDLDNKISIANTLDQQDKPNPNLLARDEFTASKLELERKIKYLENRILALENQKPIIVTYASSDTGVSELEDRIDDLDSEADDLDSKIDDLEGRFEDHQSCLRTWNSGSGPAMQDDIWHCSNK